MEKPLRQRLSELPGPLLLTGHTGFKGTWMTFLLEHLNIPVVGYSLPAEENSLFERAARTGAIPERFADLRDYETLEKFIDEKKPSTIIHMAAQPLVLESYQKPRETFEINVMGTVNLLDAAFKKNFIKAIIVVTTDKVYRNDNLGLAFVETDPLEGKDPYSASKVGAEAVVAAWQQIANVTGGPRVVSVRAGNVIGGGDFAANRIIPDLIRGVLTGNPVEVRNPANTRPWQHVLDPLMGYLKTLAYSLQSSDITSINFGPLGKNLTVSEVTDIATSIFKDLRIKVNNEYNQNDHLESNYLNLDSGYALKKLGWQPHCSQEISIRQTLDWWTKNIMFSKTAEELCKNEITEYLLSIRQSKSVTIRNPIFRERHE